MNVATVLNEVYESPVGIEAPLSLLRHAAKGRHSRRHVKAQSKAKSFVRA